jgi:hypothetical protein
MTWRRLLREQEVTIMGWMKDETGLEKRPANLCRSPRSAT